MQIFTIHVGETKSIFGTPKDANNSVSSNTGAAVLTNVDDSIAHKTNGTGDGLTSDITGFNTGSTVFTLTGHQSDGTTPFASNFQVNVIPGEPTHFDFSLL